MFVISELQDLVEIKASSLDKKQDLLDTLRAKYFLKFVCGVGVSVHVNKILEILEFEIKSEFLVANVIFELIFYKFYEGEVACGKIIKQEEEKITVEDSLSVVYEINAMDLFENCEFETINDNCKWMWNYKGNHLPFQNGDIVRFKIKSQRNDDIVEGSMDEQGLGPIKWWD
jgi:DNA-directed RNA polymerase subunit E'/Rpb7